MGQGRIAYHYSGEMPHPVRTFSVDQLDPPCRPPSIPHWAVRQEVFPHLLYQCASPAGTGASLSDLVVSTSKTQASLTGRDSRGGHRYEAGSQVSVLPSNAQIFSTHSNSIHPLLQNNIEFEVLIKYGIKFSDTLELLAACVLAELVAVAL